jgi:hypothetical protein
VQARLLPRQPHHIRTDLLDRNLARHAPPELPAWADVNFASTTFYPFGEVVPPSRMSAIRRSCRCVILSPARELSPAPGEVTMGVSVGLAYAQMPSDSTCETP